jgi:ribosomal protein S27AE
MTPGADADPDAEAEAGGDPVCWAHLTCPECGAVPDRPHQERCPRCGEKLPGEG